MMRVITSNKDKTVGIVTGIPGLKNLGEFNVQMFEEWIRQVRMVLGEDTPISIEFKLSENPAQPAYGIFASHDCEEPHVGIIGTHLKNGEPWKDKKPEEKK